MEEPSILTIWNMWMLYSFLGMLEKAVFFSEYNNINITGETSKSKNCLLFFETLICFNVTSHSVRLSVTKLRG